MKKLGLLLVVSALVGALSFWLWHARASARPDFRTATLFRGRLQATISATGTIQPEEVVDVGAQVAGRIEKFGPDPRDPTKTIDYGSAVEQETVLAQLDASLYKARRDAAAADLTEAKADLAQQLAKLHQAEADWRRAKELESNRAIAQADVDLARANFEIAQATVGLSDAKIGQMAATLKEAETNLDYTTIRSPVKGVIVDRRVNIGQTVVASLQAPSLFLIAKDLHKVEVWATVNEADVGRIQVGQPVRFSVDAYPGKVFQGKILNQGDYPARLNANMTQNVVTYTVVVSVDNSDGLLWPYLTANLQFIVSDKSDALLVPNAALRWQPTPAQIAPDARKDYAQKGRDNQDRGVLWVQDNGFARPVAVRLGLSDGVSTEVLSDAVREGMQFVIGEGRHDVDNAESNPFTPQFVGKKSQP